MIEDNPIKQYISDYNRNRETDLAKYELRKARDAQAKVDKAVALKRERQARYAAKRRRNKNVLPIKPMREY